MDKLTETLASVFPGEVKTLLGFDEVVDDTNNYYQDEFLNSLTSNDLPPHKLNHKKNYPIILLRNLNPSKGSCNTTNVVCRRFTNKVIHAEITIGQHVGKHLLTL